MGMFYYLLRPATVVGGLDRPFYTYKMKLTSYVVVLLLLVCAVSVSAQSAANWTEFKDEDLGVQVLFPGSISRSSEMIETETGKKFSVTYTSTAGGLVFMLSAAEIPEGKGLAVKDLFDGGREGMLSIGADAKVTAEKDVKVDGRSARDISVATKELAMRTRLFYVDGRLYQALATFSPAMSKDAKATAEVTKFIDSVKFTASSAK